MKQEEIIEVLKNSRQQHILNHCRQMDPEKKAVFFKGLQGIDLPLVFKLHKKYSQEKNCSVPLGEIGPAPIIPIPKTIQEKARRQEARLLGESLLRENQVAVLIVAGGQGSRLGFPGPKGKFPISPVQKKPLFQLFAESVKALSIRYQRVVPLLIMTSQENRLETREYFKAQNYFGLGRGNLIFFEQGVLPTLTPEGQLILRDDAHLLTNPDGHGGTLKALYRSGLLEQLREKGFSELFYCQVDNPLVKIADPVFIGYHRLAEAEISTKVVRRRNPEEKVGIYGAVNDRPTIIEYSDFSPEEYRSADDQGNLRYWAGNTAIHMISLAFIQRLNQHGFALPHHRAIREVEIPGGESAKTKMKVWKFETFIFDSIPLAQKTCCMEVIREEEFSPLKNLEGNDSPETARAALNSLHQRWLRETGAEVSPGARVEISPLYALDKEELFQKMKGKKIIINGDCYIDSAFQPQERPVLTNEVSKR